jgi:hypothetical protein
MHTNGPNTHGRLHRGSFADGQASPAHDPGEQHVGTFSEGEARPEAYPGQNHLGSFAQGEAQPSEYDREDHEGTFASASQTYKPVPDSVRAPENHRDKSEV